MITNKALSEIGKVQTIQARDKFSNDKFNMRQEVFVSYSPFQVQASKRNSLSFNVTEQQQDNQRRLFSQQLMNQKNKLDTELSNLGFGQSKEQFQKYGLMSKNNNSSHNEFLLDQEIFEFNDFQIDQDALNDLTESQAKLLGTSDNQTRNKTRTQSKKEIKDATDRFQTTKAISRQSMSTLTVKERSNIYERREEIEIAYRELLKRRQETHERRKVLTTQYSDEIEQKLQEKMKEYKGLNQKQNEEIDRFNLKIKEKYAQYKLEQRKLEAQIQHDKEVNIQREIDRRNREIINEMRDESIIRRRFTQNNEKVEIRRLEYQKEQLYKIIDEKTQGKENATSRSQQLLINKEMCQIHYQIEKINQQLLAIPYYRQTHKDLTDSRFNKLISETEMNQICKGQINTARMKQIVNEVQGNVTEQESLVQEIQRNKPKPQYTEEEEKFINIQVKEAHEIFSYTHALSGIINTYNQLLENYAFQLNQLDKVEIQPQQQDNNQQVKEKQDELPKPNLRIQAYETIINTIKPIESLNSDPIMGNMTQLNSPKEKPDISKYSLISKSFGGSGVDLLGHIKNMSLPVIKKNIKEPSLGGSSSSGRECKENNDNKNNNNGNNITISNTITSLPNPENNELLLNEQEIQNAEQIASIVDTIIPEPEARNTLSNDQSNPQIIAPQASEAHFSMSFNAETNSPNTGVEPLEGTSQGEQQQIITQYQNIVEISKSTSQEKKKEEVEPQNVTAEEKEREVDKQNILDTDKQIVAQSISDNTNQDAKEAEEYSTDQFKELSSKQIGKSQNQIINAYNIINAQFDRKEGQVDQNEKQYEEASKDKQQQLNTENNELTESSNHQADENKVMEDQNEIESNINESEQNDQVNAQDSKQSVIHTIPTQDTQIDNENLSSTKEYEVEQPEDQNAQQEIVTKLNFDVSNIVSQCQDDILQVYNIKLAEYCTYLQTILE